MLILLTIAQYFITSITDVMDKFFITAKKIEPFSYTFYTVVSGSLLLLAWPFIYVHSTGSSIGIDLLSGAWFSLAMFVFYSALSEGEVSRVVPFVWGLVPVFDIIIGIILKRNLLTLHEVAAMCLLIPGALLLTLKKGTFLGKHVALKVTAAFLLSSYNYIWQFGASHGPVFNNLMWNRVGAAAVLLLLLIIPPLRRKIFNTEHIQDKPKTSLLFLIKQTLGGGSFVLLSYLYAVGTIPIISALQGFRYAFLFVASILMTQKFRHILHEDIDPHTIRQKLFALSLIFLGTLLLFL